MLKSKLHFTKVNFYHNHIHSLISIFTIHNQIWRLYLSILLIFEGNNSVYWVWCWEVNSFALTTKDFVIFPIILNHGIPNQTTKTMTGHSVRFMKMLSCWDKCWDLISVYLLLINVCTENHFYSFWKLGFKASTVGMFSSFPEKTTQRAERAESDAEK